MATLTTSKGKDTSKNAKVNGKRSDEGKQNKGHGKSEARFRSSSPNFGPRTSNSKFQIGIQSSSFKSQLRRPTSKGKGLDEDKEKKGHGKGSGKT